MSGRRVALSRAPRGNISWVTFLIIVLLVVGAYLAWVWVPVYYENYAVRQVVRDYMNQAIKNPNDARLRTAMVLKIRSLAEVEGLDRWGQVARLPAVPLEERDVTWDRDTRTQPPMLHVAFDYVREVNLPLLDRVVSKQFTVDLTSDLTVPNWGPAR